GYLPRRLRRTRDLASEYRIAPSALGDALPDSILQIELIDLPGVHLYAVSRGGLLEPLNGLGYNVERAPIKNVPFHMGDQKGFQGRIVPVHDDQALVLEEFIDQISACRGKVRMFQIGPFKEVL